VEIEKSLKSSLWDGAFWSLTLGFSEIYFSPFALFLGATPLLLGILMSLPPLFGSLSQLLTPLAEKKIGSRKKLVLGGIGWQGIALLLMALIPFYQRTPLFLLFLLLSFYWVAWMIQFPAWQSWMGDLVPEKKRGFYFSKRNRIVHVVTFLSLIAAGAFLSRFQKQARPLEFGFLVLFLMGGAGRFLSFFAVKQQKDLETNARDLPIPSFAQFIRRSPRHSLGIFVLFSTFFSVAVNLSAPYFIPYFLEDLRFSYLQLMGLLAAMVASKFLFLPYWGRHSDLRGSRKPFILAAVLFSLNPFFFLFFKNYYYLMAIQIFLGFGLGGFELLSFNFLLENTPPEERTTLVAYYETLVGIGTLVGSLLGGALLSFSLPVPKSYALLFLLSGIVRILLSLAFLPRIVRNPNPLSPSPLPT
jgi:MFS family permease